MVSQSLGDSLRHLNGTTSRSQHYGQLPFASATLLHRLDLNAQQIIDPNKERAY